MPFGEESFEDEMIRLAEEMSLLDEFNLHWNPSNLDEVFHQIGSFEQKINDLMGMSDINREIEQQPLSDVHIKELFGLDGYYDSKENSNLSLDPFQDFYLEGNERKNRDTIYSINKSLKWYKEKVVKETERTSSEEKLTLLLDLNDRITLLLAKASGILSQESADSDFSNGIDRNHSGSKDEANSDMSPIIMSAIYALRRGVDRNDTLQAVLKLVNLCNVGREINLPAVKQMMAAGALPVLLSVLSRSLDWPEVELQISKVVSVLVTHEDDWSLLQRSASIIISALYTLELKTHSRTRSASESGHPIHSQDGSISNSNSGSDVEHGSEIKELVAAAIVKLSSALSIEWIKQELPIGGDLTAANLMTVTSILQGTNQYSIDRDKQRYSLSRTQTLKNVHGATVVNSTTSAAEAARTLQILLNLMSALCESSLLYSLHSMSHEYTLDSYPTSNVSKAHQTITRDGANTAQLIEQSMHTGGVDTHSSSKSLQNYEIDSFLIKYFDMSLMGLVSGGDRYSSLSAPNVLSRHQQHRTKLIDSATVLCSDAILQLSKVPQCRQGLVSGGALRMIKTWLESGIIIFENIKAICFEHMHLTENYKNFQERFFELFKSTFSLISNATAALVNLSGGSNISQDGLHIPLNSPKFPSWQYSQAAGSTSTINDYMIGWIDAQILAEGLPEILVRLVIASHESYLYKDSDVQPCRLVLPAVISKGIAQFFSQFISRPQNRQRLQGNAVPFALCTMFQTAVDQVKYVLEHPPGTSQDFGSKDTSDSTAQAQYIDACKLYREIFEFNILEGMEIPESSLIPASNECKVNSASFFTDRLFGNVGMKWRISETEAPASKFSPKNNFNQQHPPKPKKSPANDSVSSFLHEHNYPLALIDTMAAISSSCLDAIELYFRDEINALKVIATRSRRPSSAAEYTQINGSSTGHILPLNYSNAVVSNGNINTNNLPNIPTSPLIELLCNRKIVIAILMAASSLPKGQGRLSALRLIASFSDWPDTVCALYQCPVMEILMHISTELEEVQRANTIATANVTRSTVGLTECDDGSLRFTTRMSAAPSLERNVSNTSSISGASSCNSTKGGRSLSKMINSFGGGSLTGQSTPLTESSHNDDEFDYDQADRDHMISQEETLQTVFSLANLCHADSQYALIMYKNGLNSIMTSLVLNENYEISRQSVRCMHAMCRAVAMILPSDDKSGISKVTRKNQLFDFLNMFIESLKSPSDQIQREALIPISFLVLEGDKFCDRVVDQSLRSIVSFLTNPTMNADIKVAAEDVLKNIGFTSGYKDLEICGFDYEIMKDWYGMKRCLNSQTRALKILREWMNLLFNEEDNIDFANGSHQSSKLSTLLHGEYEDKDEIALHLINEAATILHINVTVNNHAHAKQDNSHNNHSTGGNSSTAGISFPSLSSTSSSFRQVTENFLKILPTCFPKTLFNPGPLVPGGGGDTSYQDDDNASYNSRGSFSSSHRQSCGGIGVDNVMGGQQIHRSAQSFSGINNALLSASNGSTSITATVNSDQHYNWIDRPPLIVTNLLDLFYFSKLLQYVVMDLISLGVSMPTLYNVTPDDTTTTNMNEYNLPRGKATTSLNFSGTSQASIPSTPSNLSSSASISTSSPNTPLTPAMTRNGNNNGSHHNTINNSLSGKTPKVNNGVATIHELLEDSSEDESEQHLVLPFPHEIFAILLPSRVYPSFTRVGRVLQRMFESYNDAQQLWSLSFRDCEFYGDFHTSLITTLQRCPQICSLNFSSPKRVEEDALLGHLVGQLPSTVKFIGFKKTLSRASIEALCIMLRTHNAAFTLPNIYFDGQLNENNTVAGSTKSSYSSMKSAGSSSGKPTANAAAPSIKTPEKCDDFCKPPSFLEENGQKGLLGLALTHLSFEASEIEHITELLNPPVSPFRNYNNATTPVAHRSSGKQSITPTSANGNSLKFGGGKTDNISMTPRSTDMSMPSATAIPISPSNLHLRMEQQNCLRGLKYIDLSYNNLTDLNCANILEAAVHGPLEALELGGNMINRGVKFLETLAVLNKTNNVKSEKQSSKSEKPLPNRLRYLGISYNGFPAKTVISLLLQLQHNKSLTALDISGNSIDAAIAHTNKALRNFLKQNDNLRVLDLSYNKLSPEIYREIHLGLLENSTICLLPLIGNNQVEFCPTMELIQKKLRANRLNYKYYCREDIFNNLGSQHGFFYGRYSLSENDFVPTTIGVNNPTSAETQMSAPDNPNGLMDATTNMMGSDIPIVAAQPIGEDSFSSHQLMTSKDVEGNSATTTDSTYIVRDAGFGSPSKLKKIPSGIPVQQSAIRNGLTPLAIPFDDDALLNISNHAAPTPTSAAAIAIAVPIAPLSPSPRGNGGLSFSSAGSPKFNNGNPLTVQDSSLHIPPKSKTTRREEDELIPVQESKSTSSIVNNLMIETSATSTSLSSSNNNHNDNVLEKEKKAIALNSSSQRPTLHVLFSAPLAGLRQGKPHPLEVLDYTSERDSLIQAFKEVQSDINLHFDFATTDSLRTILSFGCKALHFSGHGLPKGLCFEDGKSGLQILRDVQLEDLLSAGACLALEFMFVSACFSKEIGEAFVKAGVKHVVCVKIDSKIQDAAAIAFTRQFYIAFLSGRTVKQSFEIAKEALKLSPYVPDSVLEGEKFVLLPEEPDEDGSLGMMSSSSSTKPEESKSEKVVSSVVPTKKSLKSKLHNRILFTHRPINDWPSLPGHCSIGANRIDMKLFLSRIRIPSPPTDFEGREVVMNTVIRHIFDRRLVSLVGEYGVGKSAVAAAVCKYLADRDVFSDAIVYVKAKNITEYADFVSQVKHALVNCGVNNAVTRRTQDLLLSMGGSGGSSATTTTVSTLSHAHASSSDSMMYGSLLVDHNNVHNQKLMNDEALIFTCLEPFKVLLVLDNLDDLLADYGEAVTDMRLFLSRLFEQCPQIKVLNVSTDTLMMHNIQIGFGVVEYSVPIGPLTLNSTLRLFARLAPSLTTIQDKLQFIENFQPAMKSQLHSSMHSREVNDKTLQILDLFGEGHPAKIVHMACESTTESIEDLKRIGMSILRASLHHHHS